MESHEQVKCLNKVLDPEDLYLCYSNAVRIVYYSHSSEILVMLYWGTWYHSTSGSILQLNLQCGYLGYITAYFYWYQIPLLLIVQSCERKEQGLMECKPFCNLRPNSRPPFWSKLGYMGLNVKIMLLFLQNLSSSFKLAYQKLAKTVVFFVVICLTTVIFEFQINVEY